MRGDNWTRHSRKNRGTPNRYGLLHRATEIDEEVGRQFAFQQFGIDLLRRKAAVLRDILQLHLLRADSLTYEAYFRLEGGEGG